MPGGCSTELRGGEGEFSRSLVPLGGWQVPDTGRFVESMRTALTQAGYKAKDYAGHSFRIGAATTAAQRGIQDSLIKTLGRWESSAYTRYIRTPPPVLQGVAKILCRVDEHE